MRSSFQILAEAKAIPKTAMLDIIPDEGRNPEIPNGERAEYSRKINSSVTFGSRQKVYLELTFGQESGLLRPNRG